MPQDYHPQYVKAGPASKIASQVRYITLSSDVLGGLNAFVDEFMKNILSIAAREEATSSSSPHLHLEIPAAGENGRKEDQEIRYPCITTDGVKQAIFSICGKNNPLIREAVLEAEFVRNEWMKRSAGRGSNYSTQATHQDGYTGQGTILLNRRDEGIDVTLLQVPCDSKTTPKSKKRRSIRFEDDEEEDRGPTLPTYRIQEKEEALFSGKEITAGNAPAHRNISLDKYRLELSKALELISPLAHDVTFNTPQPTLSQSLSPLRKVSLTYTTPLVILYLSAFFTYLCKIIIQGTAGIVEMQPRKSQAEMKDLEDYLGGAVELGGLWGLFHTQTKQHKFRFPTTLDRQRTSSLPPWPVDARRTQQGSSLQSYPQIRSLSFSGIQEGLFESGTIATPLIGSAKTSSDHTLTARVNELLKTKQDIDEWCMSMNGGELQRARLPSATGTVSKFSGPSPGYSSSFLSAVHLKVPMTTLTLTTTTTKTRRLKRAQSERSRPSSALSTATSTSTTTAIPSGRKSRKISGTGSGLMHDTILLLRKTSLRKKGPVNPVKTRRQVQEQDIHQNSMYMNNARQAGTASPVSSIPFKATGESSSKGQRRSGSSTRSGRNVLSRQQQMTVVLDEHDSVYNSSLNNSIKRPQSAKSPASASLLSGVSAKKARSEDPADDFFEDIIMRGDTLRMTLTPSRFRQNSKEGVNLGISNGTTPRKLNTSASIQALSKRSESGLPRVRTRSNSASAIASGSGSASDTSDTLPAHTVNPSSKFTTSSASIPRFKARSAVAKRRILGDDEDATGDSSSAERDAQDEQEMLDSEDEELLRMTGGGGGGARKSRTHIKKTGTGKEKESFFDILNSVPPWEMDGVQINSATPSTTTGLTKAERMMGLNASSNKSSIPSESAALLPMTARPKKFTPIANLDLLNMLDSPNPNSRNGKTSQSEASPSSDLPHRSIPRHFSSKTSNDATGADTATLRAVETTPSIAETQSMLTSTTLGDNASDFFSSKASFALTRKEFPLPPSGPAQSMQQSSSFVSPFPVLSVPPHNTSSDVRRLMSYSSSPNLSSTGASIAPSGLSSDSNTSLYRVISEEPVPRINNAALRPGQVRRMQAKDERNVERGMSDDLIAFLREASPPPPSALATSAISTSSVNSSGLPISSHGNTTAHGNNVKTSKTRLGSVNFRSFMRGTGSSKRPSTASSVEGGSFGSMNGKFSTGPGSFAGSDNLPAVDEHGRFSSSNSQQQSTGRTQHSSFLHLPRRNSESRDISRQHENDTVSTRTVGSTTTSQPAAHLAHMQQQARRPTHVSTKLGTSTMITTDGHAASPAAKKAKQDWEAAEVLEKQMEQMKAAQNAQQVQLDRYTMALGSQTSPAQAYAKDTLEKARALRDVIAHPRGSGLLPAASLTPEHSKEDLYKLAQGKSASPGGMGIPTQMLGQATATSGVDTPPTTPDEKSHPHRSAVSTSPMNQFRPLHALPEEAGPTVQDMHNHVDPRGAMSSQSASLSAVIPGMAHKHQRRLSAAIKRKPSPRVDEGDFVQASSTSTGNDGRYDDASPPFRSREASTASTNASKVALAGTPALVDTPILSTPAVQMADHYREAAANLAAIVAAATATFNDASASVLRSSQTERSSIRSVPTTLASHTTSSSLPLSDVTSPVSLSRRDTLSSSHAVSIATSRPASMVLMPLTPRPHRSGGNSAADVHDALLSLRNNMISANSVSDCLGMIDAALFEVSYDTKDHRSPSIIVEEGFSAQAEDAQQTRGANIKEVVVLKLRPRTSRYVNRAFDAIIQHYLLEIESSSPPSIFPKNYHRLPATKTYMEEENNTNTTVKVAKCLQLASSSVVETVPSLDYSASQGTATSSEEGSSTCSSYTVAEDSGIHGLDGKQDLVYSSDRATFDTCEEDEQEVLQKAAEIY